ncbi:MAG: YcxB family protein [Calothrix sp. MO_192.B10]|nr:YcxB family protein [Calothrix sp. MO_192.B10]
MYIKTKTYNLTVSEFRRLISADYFKRMKWFFIILIIWLLFNVFLAFFDNEQFWSMLIPLLLLVYLTAIPWMMSSKGQSQLNFMSRYCEIDENFFTVCYEDGSIVKLKFEHFIKVVKRSEYYFFYITKNQFHYLPLAALETEQDIHRLDLFLEGKQLIKLW